MKSLGTDNDPGTLHKLVEGEKKRFKGQELFGKALGVVERRERKADEKPPAGE